MHLPTMFAMIMMASAVMAASIAIVAHHKHADLQAWAWGLGAPEFDSKPPFFADFSFRGIANQQLSRGDLIFL